MLPEDEIHCDIETIAKDENLFHQKNFNARQQAIDYLEFQVIDRIDALRNKTASNANLKLLEQYAAVVKSGLEEVNNKMFCQLRSDITQGRYRGKFLTDLISEHFDNDLHEVLQQNATGYDNFDVFVNGLLTNQNLPAETKEREHGMVYYQKTPARIILELIEKAKFKPQDVFLDLGSGLGQATILVNLFTSVISKGVEIEPAFFGYAKTCASDLHLTDVFFINTDARYADYSSGTIFFMYTPFEGKMLQDVLQKLKTETNNRKIKLFTFGSCTLAVGRQDWLRKRNEIQNPSYELGEFFSV
jgi:hypothetical protein